jgi:hypothetical protein
LRLQQSQTRKQTSGGTNAMKIEPGAPSGHKRFQVRRDAHGALATVKGPKHQAVLCPDNSSLRLQYSVVW